MSKESQVDQLMGQIEAKIQSLCSRASEFQKVVVEIKTFENVVNSKDSKLEMSKEVDRHSEICALLSNLSVSLIRVRTLRKSLSSGLNIPQSMVMRNQAQIDRMIKDLEDARSALSYLKDSYDARLRFYHACLYHL